MTRYFTFDPINSDPANEIAKNLYTKEKGVFTVSSVYNVPLQIVETGFKNVAAESIKDLKIDDKQASAYTGKNELYIEPVTGFAIESSESFVVTT